jgi:hypothetical protein
MKGAAIASRPDSSHGVITITCPTIPNAEATRAHIIFRANQFVEAAQTETE